MEILSDYQKAQKWLEGYDWDNDPEANDNLAVICYALQDIEKHMDLEERLQAVYGNCDGLLEKVVEHLEQHEDIELPEPVFRATLLLDGEVEEWEEYKRLKKQGKLLKNPQELKESICRLNSNNMREVLFRAKSTGTGEWMEGSLIAGVFTRGGQDIPYILCPGKADYDCFEDFSEENGIFEADPETVCQYTGLTDKNGRKIFERDIVKIPYEHLEDSICKVVFNHGMFIGELADGCEESIQRRKKDMEVIGNIFDNPELLEGVRNG